MPKVLNRISEVLDEKSMEYVRPSAELLNELGISLHIWNKWLRKKLDPELWQIDLIAQFLNCDFNELIDQMSTVKAA